MKLFLAILLLMALSLGVYIYAYIATQPASVISTTVPEKEMPNAPTVTITRTNAGYEPSEVVIAPGTVVIWKNTSDSFHWPASDYHPNHSEYPGNFDPQRAIAIGETWQFTFDEVGEWGYHDHIRATVVGTILVEDPDAEAFDIAEEQVVE